MSNDGGAPRPYNAQSLERGLLALALLRDSPRGELGLTGLARELGLHKSTVHRLLTTLIRHDYVAQDATTKRYRLGLGFLEPAHQVVEHLDVRRCALRPMHALARESGESVYLNVQAGSRALCIDEVVGPQGVTLGSNVGVALPLHATATGKCFLAWMVGAEVDRVLGKDGLEAVTGHTIRDRELLLATLDQVRAQGYAVNDEETEPGVLYAAAPIFDASGRVEGAISVGAPILRGGRDRLPQLAVAVKLAAARISAVLGYRAASDLAVSAGEAAT